MGDHIPFAATRSKSRDDPNCSPERRGGAIGDKDAKAVDVSSASESPSAPPRGLAGLLEKAQGLISDSDIRAERKQSKIDKLKKPDKKKKDKKEKKRLKK